MEPIFLLFLLSAFISTSRTDAAQCENGWAAYKDEYCIKLFNSYVTYEEAGNICSAEGSELSASSLVMVKEAEMQNFLTEYTEEVYDNLWLGGKSDPTTSQFKWEDGDTVTYTNWQDGYPRNITDSENTCIEFRPKNAKSIEEATGNWANVVCRKRNMVMCQKTLAWTIGAAVSEIIKLRKQLEIVNSRVVPVGSIYIEYYNQPSPNSLWPDLVWEDVSSSYAGLFFRATGGESDNWGKTQPECAPRIIQMNYAETTGPQDPGIIDIPSNGWSPYCKGGVIFKNGQVVFERIRFNTAGCEVRPTNQAIRIWRRNK